METEAWGWVGGSCLLVQSHSLPAPRPCTLSKEEKAKKIHNHYHYWVNKECYTSIPIPEKKMRDIFQLLPGSSHAPTSCCACAHP